MAQSFVQVPPDSTGKLIDTWVTAVAGQHRQAIVIGDPSTDANVIPISSRLRLPVESEVQLDYDTGAGSENLSVIGIGLPASGGAVAGGTATNPLNVTGPLTDTQLRATPVPVSSASLPLPTGAATEATLSALNAKVTAVDTGAVVVASSALPSNAAQEAGGVLDSIASSDSSSAAVLGATTGAAVITDTNGTIQQYLRGLVKLAITAGSWLASVTGTIADDATTPGNPVMTGGFAKSPDQTDPGNVSAEDDVIRFIGDLNRRQYVNSAHPTTKNKHLDGSSAYTDQEIAAAPGSGLQIIITNIIGSTGAATALNFFLEEGSTKIFGPVYLEAVAGRGFASGPLHLPVTANTAVTLTSSAAIAQSFDIEYFIQKV